MKTIAFLMSLPTLVSMAIWAMDYIINPAAEKISLACDLIAQAAVPWWIPVIQFLLPLGILGGVATLVLLYLVANQNG